MTNYEIYVQTLHELAQTDMHYFFVYEEFQDFPRSILDKIKNDVNALPTWTDRSDCVRYLNTIDR